MIDLSSDDVSLWVPREKHLVVCVDDEPSILASLRRVVRREPFEFLTTEDPAEALALCRRRTVSVLVSDHRMPTMSGTDLLKAAAVLSPGTMRMILTGYSGSTLIEGGLQSIHWMMGKPWSDEEFRLILRRLVRHYENSAPLFLERGLGAALQKK